MSDSLPLILPNSTHLAVTVRTLPATNTRGTRYKALCARGSVTISADDELSPEGNARAAAEALSRKFEREDVAQRKRMTEEAGLRWTANYASPWTARHWIGGALPAGGWVFVHLPEDYELRAIE